MTALKEMFPQIHMSVVIAEDNQEPETKKYIYTGIELGRKFKLHADGAVRLALNHRQKIIVEDDILERTEESTKNDDPEKERIGLQVITSFHDPIIDGGPERIVQISLLFDYFKDITV